MSTFLRDQQSTRGQPKDFAKEVGIDGITALLKIICKAYKNLRSYRKITSEMSEKEITEELYYELLGVWKTEPMSYHIRPIHEKSHGRKKGRGTTPVIDFCFRGWNQYSYFGAECNFRGKE